MDDSTRSELDQLIHENYGEHPPQEVLDYAATIGEDGVLTLDERAGFIDFLHEQLLRQNADRRHLLMLSPPTPDGM